MDRNIEENGRSMVEMLGVLAVIGVLSVGGLVGYSKAMMKYRINKTMSQISLIAGNIRSFFASQRNYTGLDSSSETGISLIKKANLIPANMISDNLEECASVSSFKSYVLNEWGDIMRVTAFNSSAFVVALHSIPTEACIEIAMQDWSSANVPVVYINNTFHSNSGTNHTLKTPADAAKVLEGCSSDDGLSDLVLYFDEDLSRGSWPTEFSS